MTTSASRETGESAHASVTFLLREGDPAPADVAGCHSRIDYASVDDAENVAFSGCLSGAAVSGGLFLHTRNGTRTLLRAGDPTPAGGCYQRFSELDVSSLSTPNGWLQMVLFKAELDGCSSPQGLFLWTANRVQVVAMAEGKAPRGQVFRSFERPTLVAVHARSGPGFVLAYEARLDSGGRSVVVHPSYAVPLESLATGDRLGDDEVTDFSLSRMGGCLSCNLSLRDGAGTASRQVGFIKHGVVIHGGALKEGARFPSLAEVREILDPPAVSLQLAITAVRFADGTTGLVASDVIGNARLFAKTGDDSRADLDDPIESFGPPVSNARFPSPGPVAVVAPVRLRSGRRALWRSEPSMSLAGGGGLLIFEHGAASPTKLADGKLLLHTHSEDEAARAGTPEGRSGRAAAGFALVSW